MRVGVAGLGKMGSAIAGRLNEMGEELVVWNRSRHVAESSELPIAENPKQLAEHCDVVISSLFDDAAVLDVYERSDGLLAGGAGKLFIEMSTVRPAIHRDLAVRCRKLGAGYVECPVGGTTGPARSGQLLGLAGGEPHDVQRALPLLDKLCRRVELIGPAGSGAIAKLAINLPLVVFWQSFGEALALAGSLGKDSQWLVSLFADSAGAPKAFAAKAKDIVAGLDGNESIPPSFAIYAMRKDLALAISEASSEGHDLPVAAATFAALNELCEEGLGERDCVYVPLHTVHGKG